MFASGGLPVFASGRLPGCLQRVVVRVLSSAARARPPGMDAFSPSHVEVAPFTSGTESAPAFGAARFSSAAACNSSAGSSATSTSFSELAISAAVKRSIVSDMKFVEMTPVQAATLPIILNGRDLLAKAKTGTGKTLAFLVPTIERLASGKGPPQTIGALILSPTRELAAQTAAEAVALARHTSLRTCVVVGGTNIATDVKRMHSQVDILVATPGRLVDHLKTTPDFARRLEHTRVLVLDEGDRLLDAGFLPDIKFIIRHLPSAARQTLCFSATVPPELQSVLGVALKRDHAVVDGVGSASPDTHASVPQLHIAVPSHGIFGVLLECLQAEMRLAPTAHKIIVFFATANETKLGAAVLQSAGMRDVLEIHSRKTQPAREKAAAAFRAASRAIMCTSDVSARGVDYPDVSLVIQVGLPTSREQYIHRVGRTGRAGKGGQGMILLAPHESAYARSMLHGLSIAAPVSRPVSAATSAAIPSTVRAVPEEVRAKAYQAWLGFHSSITSKLKWTDVELVRHANEYATAVLGFPVPPPLEQKTISKMGLKGVPGLNVARAGPQRVAAARASPNGDYRGR